MNVYVIDPDYPAQENRRNWSVFLGKEILPNPTIPERVDPFGVVFIHGQFPVNDLIKFADANTNSVVVVISGGRTHRAWHDAEHKYWRKNPVAKPNDERFAKNAKMFLADFAQSGKANFSLLEPYNNEVLFALRLLCEAWLLKHWPDRVTHPELQTLRSTLQIQGDKPQVPKGIDLKPPSNRDEWLKPFREGGDTTDPLPAILNEMPTEETKRIVRDFFSKLNGGQVEFEDVADLFLEMDAVIKKST